MPWTVTTPNDLPTIADELLARLPAGAVVALNGPMGVGKTTLVQAIAHILTITERVNSPTFNLLHAYTTGVRPLLHVDLYRLGPEKSQSIAEDIFDWIDQHPQGLTLIEWAEYATQPGADWLSPALTATLTMTRQSDDQRQITLTMIKGI